MGPCETCGRILNLHHVSCAGTLRQSNMACRKNQHVFIDDVPIKTSIYNRFPSQPHLIAEGCTWGCHFAHQHDCQV